ncbi:MAG TPA: BspA family leucine-rich repeat surface protein [Candidatus Marinimicrobia bacterium]|nr:BspA family leucine-rich repeat surface protein [Candidatus Neomarinimicrobiota bacterium]
MKLNQLFTKLFFVSIIGVLFVPGVTLAQWQPQTIEELETAVNMWVNDNETALATYGEINTWDISLMDELDSMFGYPNFNDDISNWDVSNVTNMSYLFSGATSFNQDLSSWDVSSVESMGHIFYGATSFNQDLSSWDVSNVTNMYGSFWEATNFNGDISNWDVSSVTSMRNMFKQASNFNQNMSSWNVSSVTNMYSIFHEASNFNQDISSWDLSSVTSTRNMFYDATSFNQDISLWDVSGVGNMSSMFHNANALSDENRCAIHTSFSSNENWPYDWSELCEDEFDNEMTVIAGQVTHNGAFLFTFSDPIKHNINLEINQEPVQGIMENNYNGPLGGFGFSHQSDLGTSAEIDFSGDIDFSQNLELPTGTGITSHSDGDGYNDNDDLTITYESSNYTYFQIEYYIETDNGSDSHQSYTTTDTEFTIPSEELMGSYAVDIRISAINGPLPGEELAFADGDVLSFLVGSDNTEIYLDNSSMANGDIIHPSTHNTFFDWQSLLSGSIVSIPNDNINGRDISETDVFVYGILENGGDGEEKRAWVLICSQSYPDDAAAFVNGVPFDDGGIFISGIRTFGYEESGAWEPGEINTVDITAHGNTTTTYAMVPDNTTILNWSDGEVYDWSGDFFLEWSPTDHADFYSVQIRSESEEEGPGEKLIFFTSETSISVDSGSLSQMNGEVSVDIFPFAGASPEYESDGNIEGQYGFIWGQGERSEIEMLFQEEDDTGCDDENACNMDFPGDCIYPDENGDCIYPDNGNYALEFDGDDEVKITGGEFIPGNEPRSISVWIDGGSGNIVSLGSGNHFNQRFSILVDQWEESGEIRLIGENNDFESGYSLSENPLQHIVVTHNGSVAKIYANGQLLAEEQKEYNTNGEMPIMIGTNTDDRNDEYYNGIIDNVIITGDELSEEEILSLYNSEELELDNIVARYNFNEGEGIVLYDNSGNQNHGVIDGASWWIGCSDGEVSLWGNCYNIEETTGINLESQGLYGEIPPEIGDLINLNFLHLGGNNFSGVIPSEIGNLVQMGDLILGGNNFEGEIPGAIYDLTNLGVLNLGDNNFSGEISSEIGNLTNLAYFILAGNQLTGTIPSEIGSLSELRHVILGNNDFSGVLPSTLGDLHNLEILFIENNDFEGEFPDIFSNSPNFNDLNARDNNFSSISEGICGAIDLLFDDHPFDNNMICEVPACLDDVDLGCQNCDGVDCGDDGSEDEGCEPCDGADGCGNYYSEGECLDNEGCEWLGQDGSGCDGCDPCDGADGCGNYYSEGECLDNEGCEWLGWQDGPGCGDGGGDDEWACFDDLPEPTWGDVEPTPEEVCDWLNNVGFPSGALSDCDWYLLTDWGEWIANDFPGCELDMCNAYNVEEDCTPATPTDDANEFFISISDTLDMLIAIGETIDCDNLGESDCEEVDGCGLDDDGSCINVCPGAVEYLIFDIFQSNLDLDFETTGSCAEPWEAFAPFMEQLDLNCSALSAFSQAARDLGEGGCVSWGGPAEDCEWTSGTCESIGDGSGSNCSGCNPGAVSFSQHEECTQWVTDINECNAGDLQVLEEFIAQNGINEETSMTDYDDGDGTFEALEMGEQIWVDGRLTKFNPFGNWNNDPTEFSYGLTVVPENIGDLNELKYIDLDNNQLETLPESFGDLSLLETLWLGRNPLEVIPESIFDLLSLSILGVYETNISGIPSNISNLTNLTYLTLSNNQLTGEIPLEIFNLTNLERLFLWENQLSGEIPSEIGNLTNLWFLSLSYNQLSGEFPSEIGNLTNLERIYLQENQLSGEIPPEIGNLTNLERLFLWSNQLSGEIPSEIGNLTNLERLRLFENQLSGEIPSEICNISSLYSVELHNNNLCPPYPECLSGEEFNDSNGNGVYDEGEDFVDSNENGTYDDPVGDQDTSNCGESSVTVDHISGWNLVSLPMAVSDATYSSIYPDAVGGTLYGFNGIYVEGEILENGDGYWLFFDTEGSTDVNGSPLDQLTISLSAGWNLIGSLSSAFELSSIDDPEGIIISGSIYGFDEIYYSATTFQPGKGYWINASSDGQVTLNSDGSARIKPFVDRTLDANVIRFNGLPLYFGVTIPESELQSYILPPKPPAGASDVRFKDGWRFVGDYGEIEVMNTSETLTISYDIKIQYGKQYYWVLTSETGEEIILGDTGEIVVPSVDRFILQLKTVVPATFTLHQNFPNPFNPITTLSYDLPKDSDVGLAIFDMLGNEVVTLVSAHQQAGFKSVQWDAKDSMGRPVGGGVYLYQIKAGEFVQTKKMVLLK